MADIRLENVNPTVFNKVKEREISPEELDDSVVDKIDDREVFDILKKLITYLTIFCPFIMCLSLVK